MVLTGEVERPVVISFTPKQLEPVRLHIFISTIRKIFSIYEVLVALIEQIPGMMRGAKFTYLADSQAGHFDFMSMKGADALMPSDIRKTWMLVAAWRIEFRVVRSPRNPKPPVFADKMSKVKDPSQWEICEWSFTDLPLALRIPRADIMPDPFADEHNHKAAALFSLELCRHGRSGWRPAGMAQARAERQVRLRQWPLQDHGQGTCRGQGRARSLHPFRPGLTKLGVAADRASHKKGYNLPQRKDAQGDRTPLFQPRQPRPRRA